MDDMERKQRMSEEQYDIIQMHIRRFCLSCKSLVISPDPFVNGLECFRCLIHFVVFSQTVPPSSTYRPRTGKIVVCWRTICNIVYTAFRSHRTPTSLTRTAYSCEPTALIPYSKERKSLRIALLGRTQLNGSFPYCCISAQVPVIY